MLEPIVKRAMQDADMPGLTLGIVKNGAGCGARNRDRGEPVTPLSPFHMASISKPFVATAVMRLVERGTLDLDAPVVHCLPYCTLRNERAREITLRQMLCHTAALPDEDDYHWYAPEDDAGALERDVLSPFRSIA